VNMLARLATAALLGLALTGCAPEETRVLGATPAGAPSPISTVHKAPAGKPVVIAGEIVEKCPVAGCWFSVRDGSGTVRVDTKNAGFVVLDVPLHTRVTVAGKMKRSGEEQQIEASGVRY